MNQKDADLKVTRALPNGAANVTSTSIDTGKRTSAAWQSGEFEFLLTAPALNTTQLPNSATMTYDILVSDNANLGTPTTLIAGAIVQTGSGGAGAAGASYRFRLPSNAKPYVGVKATNSGAGDCTAASATLEVVA